MGGSCAPSAACCSCVGKHTYTLYIIIVTCASSVKRQAPNNHTKNNPLSSSVLSCAMQELNLLGLVYLGYVLGITEAKEDEQVYEIRYTVG